MFQMSHITIQQYIAIHKKAIRNMALTHIVTSLIPLLLSTTILNDILQVSKLYYVVVYTYT